MTTPAPPDFSSVDPPATGGPAITDEESSETSVGRKVWPWGWIVAALITCLYAATWHPWWTIGGDAELYLSIARNLARGDGYRYNGQPIGLVTPLWPVMLAGALKLTTSIGLLKLITLGSIGLFLWAAYRVLLRMVTRPVAAVVVLAVAIVHPLVELADTFFTDPPFCAAAWLCLLACIKSREALAEGRRGGGAIFGLLGVALLVAAILLRWTGVLWTPVAMVAYFGFLTPPGTPSGTRSGPPASPGLDRSRWVYVVLLALAGGITFLALRFSLNIPQEMVDPRYDDFITGRYSVLDDEKSQFALWKVQLTPDYLGVLGWNLIQRNSGYLDYSRILTKLALIPIAATILVQIVRRRWLWALPLLYLLAIVLRRPHPIGRYVLPAAPVLLAAFVVAAGEMWTWRNWLPGMVFRRIEDSGYTSGRFVSMPQQVALLPGRIDIRKSPLRFLVAGVVLLYIAVPSGLYLAYNGSAWALEIMASHRASTREVSIVSVGEAARDLPGEVAVTSLRYQNQHRLRTLGPRRAVQFIADRPLVNAPTTGGQWPSRKLMDWALAHDVRYYIDQTRYKAFGPLYKGPPERGRWRLWKLDPEAEMGWREVEVTAPLRTSRDMPISPTGRP